MPSVSPPQTPEHASAAILAPALLLVVLALAAIAVDLSALHHAHRSIHRAVATAADDAAGLLDGHHLQVSGQARIDRGAATRFVGAQLARTTLPGELVDVPTVTFDETGSQVTVRAEFDVDHLVARSATGRPTSSRLVVTASARMVP
jgi:hypothetical protein